VPFRSTDNAGSGLETLLHDGRAHRGSDRHYARFVPRLLITGPLGFHSTPLALAPLNSLRINSLPGIGQLGASGRHRRLGTLLWVGHGGGDPMPPRTIALPATACAEIRNWDRSCRFIDARALGMLEAEMHQVRQELATLRSSVTEISRMRHETRGGWGLAALLFPIVSACCAAAALFLSCTRRWRSAVRSGCAPNGQIAAARATWGGTQRRGGRRSVGTEGQLQNASQAYTKFTGLKALEP
jgi:hypothetical protein